MRLPFPCILAWRYLRSGRRDSYVRFLGVLATGGITLGVAALILVLAGLSGLQAFLRSDVLARTPHIEVELAPGERLVERATEARQRLTEVPGVEAARLVLRGRAWLLADGTAQPVQAIGFADELPPLFPGASGREEGLYVDLRLAAARRLELGHTVEIASPRPTLTPFGPQPRVHRLPLAGTFLPGQTELETERRVALPLDTARRLFGDRNLRLELTAADLHSALKVAAALPAVLPAGSRVRTWEDLNRPLFFALRLEKVLMFVSVFLIVPVAAMALVTVLALLISSKRVEIGMLQAMGATPDAMRRAFLLIGGCLAAVGLTAGGTLGVLGAFVAERYQLIAPPGDVYFLDHIPFVLEGTDLLLVGAASALLTLVSTIWAARRAAAFGVVEALGR